MNAADVNAELYDAFHNRYVEDLPFWLELAAAYPPPALELGCGTGRVLLALAQAGREIWGLDRDAAMLNLLSLHSEQDPSLRAHLVLADMVDFKVPEKFGLIISPCNTFSTLSDHQRRAALARVRAHLLPGGCFSASLPNPHTLAQIPPQWEAELEDDFLHPRTGNPVQVSSRYFRQDGDFVLEWFYDELLPDGSAARTTAVVHHALTPLNTYLQDLEETGLKLQDLWGDFDRSPFAPDSPALIWEAVLPTD